jgi:Ran GTPase-activating protein (RanGAP) involved in mRNA processing and transport
LLLALSSPCRVYAMVSTQSPNEPNAWVTEACRVFAENEGGTLEYSLPFQNINPEICKMLSSALKKDKYLEVLNLHHNPIGDDGLFLLSGSLKKMRTLRHLTLSQCGITDEGAKTIVEILTQNACLETIELQMNAIGSDGADAIGDCLVKQKTLRFMDLTTNKIKDAGIRSLVMSSRLNTTCSVDVRDNVSTIPPQTLLEMCTQLMSPEKRGKMFLSEAVDAFA